LLATQQPLAQGDCIIAPPRMEDGRFHKTVIMLTQNKQGGQFGLCVNKPSNHTVRDLNAELDCELPPDIPLYWGGPVNPQTIWMLHTTDWISPNTQMINDTWAMTSHISMFHHLADGDRPQHFVMTFGYCGWSNEQLAAELKGDPPYKLDSSWLTWRNPDSRLLDVDSSELWRISCEQSSHQAVAHWMV
jgi:putative transcriptional regulator